MRTTAAQRSDVSWAASELARPFDVVMVVRVCYMGARMVAFKDKLLGRALGTGGRDLP